MMQQLVALGLAFLGLAIPLIVLFYFTNRREKQDRATAKQRRRGEE